MHDAAGPHKSDVRRLNVLFVGGYDSTNYAYVELFRELGARGHTCRLVVDNPGDLINNKMFVHAGVPMLPLSDFSLGELDAVDFVICGPFVRRRVKRLFDAIYESRAFVVSFASLFSSVTMWSAPDLLIAKSESKFDEFARSGLKYSMVAVGNPQYDPLVRAREARPRKELDDIRKVLFIDQGAYPLGETGKRQLASTLVNIALNNPQMTVHVKPRYLPDEAGDHLHSVSDHLYSYLDNAPENLVLIRESTVLEDLILDFDAMITMWSTAHLDAAVLDLPLLLIGGLDSVDVFDVRKPRVDAAFEHLRGTGCVVDWRDLQTGPCPFAYVSEEYAREELGDISTPCAPRVADVLEAIDAVVLRQGRTFAGTFQLAHAEFMDRVGELETRALVSEENRLSRMLFRRLNSVAQTLAFDHRCMGYALDVSRMLQLWDVRLGPGSSEKDVDRLVQEARKTALLAKAEYFGPHPEKVATDPFVQDYYFSWLLETRRRDELIGYAGPVVAPSSLESNQGRALWRRGRLVSAARHMAESFSMSLREPVRILKRDKNVRALLSRNEPSLRAFAVPFLLDHYRKYEALSVIDVPASVYAAATAYYKMKALQTLGRAEDARALFDEYEQAIASASAPGRGGRRSQMVAAPVIAWYRMLMRRRARRL